MQRIPAEFFHAPVPGGGFVTGFVFHPACPGVLYARTDIGGVYRFDFAGNAWVSLCDAVPHTERWETFPLSLALDGSDPDRLYIAAGDRHTNRLMVSRDRGAHFAHFDIPAAIHGNAPGRGTGERLFVSESAPDTLYFASQSEGLLKTMDGGRTWEKRTVCGETNLTLCFFHPQNERVIVVGTNGEHNRTGERTRGPSLYLSRDGGETFAPLPGQPAPLADPRASHAGYMAQRAAFADGYLYVTLNMPGDCWRGFDSYACDTGSAFDGALLRYALSAAGEVLEVRDLTPHGFADPACPARKLGCGLSGICADAARPGVLAMATICGGAGDTVYHTADGGETWTPILQGLSVGHIDFTVPYMKPPYNGNHSIVHWMADLKIDPHNGDFALFTTGTGIFATRNLTDALRGEVVSWEPLCAGLEETVHLNVYSPPTGRVRLLDIIGDLGGFAFEDVRKPCENSFADERGNRYITCMNADYRDGACAPVYVTARGNWTGKTKGGLIVSEDDCRTWTRLPMPTGLSRLIDGLAQAIERPNVNAGWVALSADGRTVVWGVAREFSLPIPALVWTEDRGASWHRCTVLDGERRAIDDPEQTIKVFADRVDARIFYGFGQHGALFVSRDGGHTFAQQPAPRGFPDFDPTGIDGRQWFEIRAEAFARGVLYCAAREHGLFRLRYNEKSGAARGAQGSSIPPDSFQAERISAPGDTVFRVGLGKAREARGPQALYVNAIIGGEYGFYASFDEGGSWDRIGDDAHLFGDIRSIAGDPRTFGRFYIATGSRGVLCGDLRID